jgi:dihydrofolate reductase
MRKIIVTTFLTLDGVMQAPGGSEEDTSGGFKYGGWVAPYSDEVSGEAMKKQMEPADLLLGRKTFDIFANYWPAHASYWPGINEVTKYVLSGTLKDTDPIVTGWNNSVVLQSVADIQKLKNSDGANLKVWGSSQLVQLLLKHDLVDELWLKIYPVTLGEGKKLFANGISPSAFTLSESLVTPGGVIFVSYKRAGEVKTGNIGE